MRESDFPCGVFGRICGATVLAKVVEMIERPALTRIRKGRHAGRPGGPGEVESRASLTCEG